MLKLDQVVDDARLGTPVLRAPGGREGFSLMELLIVVAVIGLLSAIAIPNVNRTLALHRLDTSTALLASKLADARMNAIKRNRQAWVAINPTNRTVQVQTRNDANEIIGLGAAEALPSGVDFTSPTAAAQVTFDSLGRLPAGTAAWTLTLRGAQNTKRKSLSVSIAGKVTVSNMIDYAG